MELTLGTLIILAAVFVGGAFLGVLLGRRSSSANATVDRIRKQWDEETAELRAQIRRMQDKDQGAR